MNCDVTTIVSVRDGAVAYISKVDFEIRQAGRSHFQIVTPEWLGEDIEVQAEKIRQIRLHTTGDRRTWEIDLQQAVRGKYTLHMIQTLPLSDDGVVQAAIVRPLDTERSRSHIVLENLTADEIASTTTKGVTPIAVGAVPGNLEDNVRRQAVSAYRIGEDAVLAWQRRVREQETGLNATISLCDLATVIHADGSFRARAAYNIRNFTLQFLELEFPSGSDIWSVHVSGQPARPAQICREGKPVTLLPLQKASVGDFSSKVVVIYSGHLDGPLGRWGQLRPPAPRILNNIPVSRTLWTVFLPREYKVDPVRGKTNLDEVAPAYQQEERKLSFLDELNQMVRVAGSKSQSAAQLKAVSNLKQVGLAVSDYAKKSTDVETKNAADVQEQANQIEAEIKRLDARKIGDRKADVETALYFKRPAKATVGAEGSFDLDCLQDLAEQDEVFGYEARGSVILDEEPNRVAGQPTQERRGELRKQAANQLKTLQTQARGQPQSEKAGVGHGGRSNEGPKASGYANPTKAEKGTTGQTPASGQAVAGVPAVGVGTGQLSLDLDVFPVGTSHHFRKLHGEPRLVLNVRHDDLGHSVSAAIWAAVCLVLAAAAIQMLRRPNAAASARRYWPWFAAVAGAVWLFLLPSGVLGLGLLVTAVCVLIVRTHKRQTTNSADAAAQNAE
jgi:hypothetical protein